MNLHSMPRPWLFGKLGAFRGAIVALVCVMALGGGCSKSPARNNSDSGSDSKSGGDAGHADGSAADHSADGVCSTTAAPQSKGASEACACDSDCRTGFCADGVCCDTACTGTCKACNLPSSLGVCTLVPYGKEPSKSQQCPADKALTCGQDGTCDGAGACRKYVSGVECRPGTCAGDSITGALTCDGKGSCSQSATTPCFPFTCDPTTNLCAPSCTTNSQCAAGQACVAGSCGKKLTGASAKSASECQSTYLANTVCCNVACSGACVSCNQPGSVGKCKPIGRELPDPGAGCATSDPSTCGTTGLCDGFGSCAIFPVNSPCGSASCSGGELSEIPPVCDGKGTCQSAQLVNCSPYLCTKGACNGSCTTDADCETGHACVPTQVRGITTGACAGKKKNGQPCADASECDSSQCVDGYCCESSCQGACRSCGLPGSLGQCVNAAAGAPDPRSTCSDMGTTSCGTDGLCDGSGACEQYPAGYVCGPETCVLGAHTPPATCNASGQCVAPPSQTCNPYVCNGSVCYKSCTVDATQCVPGNPCPNGSCGKGQNGFECSSGNDCISGNCAQGICCDTPCAGACMACSLSGSLGLCTAVADGAPDPQGLCGVTAPATCGTTGLCKSGKCANVDPGIKCKASSCATNSSETPTSTCDGLGNCVTPTSIPCGTFICSSALCENTCKTDADCVSPNTCVNSSCGLKPAGAACTDGTQCASTFCTEGVCCNNACSDGKTGGLCMSCKTAGKVGTCSPVPSGGADPKKLCIATNALGGDCSNDGTCNGAGACRPWSTVTGCRLASCTGSTFTPSANCDGNGHCPAPTTQACNPYECNGASPSCLTTCNSNSDCTDKLTCLKITNQCGTQLPNGQKSKCKANGDCTSNVCSSEGVCCATACDGACQTCLNNAGTCTPIAVNGTPRDTTTCQANPPCGDTGKCDGNNACQLTKAGTTCGSASCAPPVSGTLSGATVSQSLAAISAGSCDGKGACSAGTTLSCGNFQCDAASAACKSGCTNTTNDCNSMTPSTADPGGGNSCVSGTCQLKPNGSACTNGFACVSGSCLNSVCCGASTCDDKLACTTDSCAPSGSCTNTIAASNCVIGKVCYAAGDTNPTNACQQCTPTTNQTDWSPKSNTTSCDDGNACTTGDMCTAGKCVGGPATNCDDSNVCTTDACNPATGCTHSNNTLACDDGNACTTGDACAGGKCVGGAGPNCDDGNPCTTDSCSLTTGCTHTNNTASCNDGNACTQTDTCQGGNCIGGNPVACTASDQCHTAGTCNTGTGVCSNPAKANGVACNDGNACTQADTCQNGVCTGSSPVVCTASDQCHTAGTCDTGTGICSNPAKANGAACTDGNACTQTDTCQGGTCTGGSPVVCTASDQCHTAGTCDTGTGICSNPAKANGAACTDGNACTQTDTCQGGTCTGGSPVVCTASDQCHTAGTCDTGTGICSNPAKANGAACTDGNACTQTDACQSGTCTGSSPVVCTASDQCHTAGTCDTGTGICSNPAKANGAACTDGNACTQTDTCQSGTCTGGNPVVCTASDQCHTAGTCDTGTGNCSNPTAANGTGCDDGNACTQTDACQSGSCVGSNPVTCTASDACHLAGTCNPMTGCSNPAVVCTALDQCHVVGTCNITSGCSNPVGNPGADCSDGTTDVCCQSNVCVASGLNGCL